MVELIKGLHKIPWCLRVSWLFSPLKGCTFTTTWTYCIFINQQAFSDVEIGDLLKGCRIQNPVHRKSMSWKSSLCEQFLHVSRDDAI